MSQIIYRRGKQDWQPEFVYDSSENKDSLIPVAEKLKTTKPDWSVYIGNCETWQVEKVF